MEDAHKIFGAGKGSLGYCRRLRALTVEGLQLRVNATGQHTFALKFAQYYIFSMLSTL